MNDHKLTRMAKITPWVIGCLFFYSLANGQSTWECTHHPTNAPNHRVTEQFVLMDGKTLITHDDYSGDAIEFQIMEKSPEELIAIHHNSAPSPRLEVIIINNRTGGFRMHEFVARNLYEEHYVGNCTLKDKISSK